MKTLLTIILLTVSSFSALAVEPSEILSDPALEARAREVSKGLRCVVCQNQSIDESNADLARDMRVLVRERISAGDSNAQVVEYMVSRYGDYVLLDPPFKASTYVLWLSPFLFIGLALAAAMGIYRRREASPVGGEKAQELSVEEQRRIQALLDEDGGGGS
ncbi:MAG: cytochrome c-type biogenesis protein CcmH [Rhodospirillaceae bacterium]|nr:cytochrome c-type biogenesis protein CcmH [Rhodospirillaceae bacterium]